MSDAIAQLISFLKADRAPILRDGHKEVFLARAPGRLDVMGGASAFAGALACQIPLEAATAVAVQRRDDRKLVLKTYNQDASRESVVTLSLDDFYGTASLLPQNNLQGLFAGGKHWAAYMAGVFPTLGKHKKLTRRAMGANMACFSNLPLGAGAASSAALECATLWAVTAAYHLILDPLEIALLAQKIENQLVGSRVGLVEPATSVLGRKDQLLLLQCQPHEVSGYVEVPAGYCFAAISCGTADEAAEARLRVGTFMAQKIVAKFFADTGVKKDPTRGYLVNLAPESLQKYFRNILPEAITGEKFVAEFGAISDRLSAVEPATTYHPRAAAEFHVAEHSRSQAFASALRDMNTPGTDPKQIAAHALASGKLMQESHSAARHGGAVGLGSTAANQLVESLAKLGPDRGIYGARVAADGRCVTILAVENARPALETAAADVRQHTPHAGLLLTGSSAGAAEAAPLRISVAELTP